jgi:hypothetical protein
MPIRLPMLGQLGHQDLIEHRLYHGGQRPIRHRPVASGLGQSGRPVSSDSEPLGHSSSGFVG